MSADKANLSSTKTKQHPKQQVDAKLPQNSRDQVNLARRAASGDAESRKVINALIHPIITYQTHRFCRRFCYGKQYGYVCTLPSQSALKAPVNAQLCEYGNASYAWMLEDLTHDKRLLQFKDDTGRALPTIFTALPIRCHFTNVGRTGGWDPGRISQPISSRWALPQARLFCGCAPDGPFRKSPTH